MKFCRYALPRRILLLIFGPLVLCVLASTVQAGQNDISEEPQRGYGLKTSRLSWEFQAHPLRSDPAKGASGESRLGM
jgi:hypothetical protein